MKFNFKPVFYAHVWCLIFSLSSCSLKKKNDIERTVFQENEEDVQLILHFCSKQYTKNTHQTPPNVESNNIQPGGKERFEDYNIANPLLFDDLDSHAKHHQREFEQSNPSVSNKSLLVTPKKKTKRRSNSSRNTNFSVLPLPDSGTVKNDASFNHQSFFNIIPSKRLLSRDSYESEIDYSKCNNINNKIQSIGPSDHAPHNLHSILNQQSVSQQQLGLDSNLLSSVTTVVDGISNTKFVPITILNKSNGHTFNRLQKLLPK